MHPEVAPILNPSLGADAGRPILPLRIQEAYKKILAENLLQGESKEARILAFKSKARPAPQLPALPPCPLVPP